MLRKKLLTRLGLLVVGFVTGAVVSIVLLQGILRDLDSLKVDAGAMIDGVRDLSTQLAALEHAAASKQATGAEPQDFAEQRIALVQNVERLGRYEVMQAPQGPAAAQYSRIAQSLPAVMNDLGTSATSAPTPADAPARSAALHSAIADLAGVTRQCIAARQTALSLHLRNLIIALAIAAIVMTNVAIFVLVRTANMILRPVGELLTGTRELAQEHFDFRIGVSQHDEFDELAQAYNSLGAQLATNEQRKVHALQQLAVTLNHELNNAINIIELRLRLLDRRAGDDPLLASHLGDIHHNLARMSQTIASLREVRRIVLTDYLPGQLMLDLARSTAAEELSPVVKASADTVARASGGVAS